jgi:hypothetical protein
MNDKILSVQEKREAEANLDPISGAPGAHPVGVGVGAAIGGLAAGIGTGAALGAATGTVVGPVGTVIGAAVGAIVGGLAGKGVAESIDPTIEQDYWRANYTQRPYFADGRSFDDYGPAYGVGTSAYTQYPGKRFDEVEPHLSRDWHANRGKSTLDWAAAKEASRDAWNRVSNTAERAIPGDSDRDGR